MKDFRILCARLDTDNFDRLHAYAKSIGVKKQTIINDMVNRFLNERDVPEVDEVNEVDEVETETDKTFSEVISEATVDTDDVTIETHTVYNSTPADLDNTYA